MIKIFNILFLDSGWTWTCGSSTSKDTCVEICGDGVDAAVKEGAAIVNIWE